MKLFIEIVLNDRRVNLGAFSYSKVEEYLKKRRLSRLWFELRGILDEQYCASTLEGITVRSASGEVLQVVNECYSPEIRKPVLCCRQTACGDRVFLKTATTSP